MGASLSAPNMSTIVETKSVHGFNVGLAEVNGWRNKMEDAHVIHICKGNVPSFFGVFDGHGGDKCSAFVAAEFYERLERHGCPKDDAATKELVLDIDAKYLALGEPSGTTAAMCIVHRPTQPGGKIRLRVANAGDSRVLLGKRDGTIVDGGGTDEGLSTDHKPDHPPERERIERCGGTVETEEGNVARVNGNLAVSRGFGDGEYKKTGGPGPEERPVTANPELEDFECDESDILIIVCDGVSEGNFSNPEVVKLISESLAKDGDPGEAAKATVLHAEKMNSKDNITCMVVLFDGNNDEALKEGRVFRAGAIAKDLPKLFVESYETMARRGGLTVEQAFEMRHDILTADIADADTSEERREELQKELEVFGDPDSGPKGEKGSEERTSWFQEWTAHLKNRQRMMSGGGLEHSMLQQIMAAQGMGGGAPEGPPDGRRVVAADAATLKEAVEAHDALKWDDRIADIAATEGEVMKEDTSDSTMQIRFTSIDNAPMSMWLPVSVLTVTAEAEGSGGYAGDSASPAP